MTHTTDAIDDDIDMLLQWECVLAVVRSSVFTDNERVAFVFFFLGVSTVDMARLITKADGTPITRERARQLVRNGLRKIFAALNAGEPPSLWTLIPYGDRVSERKALNGLRDDISKGMG